MHEIDGATWYRLADRSDPTGLSCDELGVSLGRVPLLRRLPNHPDRPRWASRDAHDLNMALSSAYGFPIDIARKVAALNAISDALNKKELVLAQLLALHLCLPELPTLSKVGRAEQVSETLAVHLHRSGILDLNAIARALGTQFDKRDVLKPDGQG
jgi:hypothetical protein